MAPKKIQAKFIKSASAPAHFLPELLPEIAVIGRSNVGKSSLLNFIFQTSGLVKTSAEPGKTRLVNFFEYGPVMYVDLPGWGYAKASKTEKVEWTDLIEHYLTHREGLKAILYLLDIRRTPTDEDRSMIHWLASKGKKVIFVVTKADKANQSELIRQKKEIENFLGEEVVITTSKEGKGREHLLKTIKDALTNG